MEIDNKKLLITIGVLLAIIAGLILYIKISMKPSDVKTEKTTIDNVKIDLNNLYEIGNTLEKFDNAFNDSKSEFFGYIYNSKKIKLKDFKKDAALYATIYSRLKYTTDTPKTIRGPVVKSDFEKIFGKDFKYTAKNIASEGYYSIKYDASTDLYSYTFIDSNIDYSPEYITININTKLDGDQVIITRKIVYVEYLLEEAGVIKATLYKDDTKKSALANLTITKGIINKKEVVGKYGSKLNTYNYTFEKSSGSSNYTFKSIEKIR